MKAFDFFQKVQEDQNLRRTTLGGLLFFATVISMILLIMNEIYLTYFSGGLQVDSFIDTSNIDQRIRVNLNLTITSVPCHALSVSIQDITGSHLEDLRHTLHKIRLNEDGTFINYSKAHKIQNLERAINYPSHPLIKYYRKIVSPKDTDDCYGAQIYEGQRCITCQDVMLAFTARDWPQPPREAIAQCMPDRKPHIQLQNFEQEMQEVLLQQQEEVLNSISLQLQEIEEREKRNELLEMKIKPEEPVLKELLSDHQKKHFKQTLQQLTEMSYNPMQWGADRLRQEKLAHVDSLIHMLNISLDDYTTSLQGQLKFTTREMLITERKLSDNSTNITTLQRAKCDDHIIITFNVTYEGENDEGVNQNTTFEKEMANGTCNMTVFYKTLVLEEDYTEISIFINDNEESFPWTIKRGGGRKSLITTFSIAIANINFKNQMMTTIQKKGLVDQASSAFRFSVYVPIQMTSHEHHPPQNGRVLYQENFELTEQTGSRYAYEGDVQEIEEHLNEGCQIYGHLFVKRVPGNLHVGFHGQGKLGGYLANKFSVSHIVNLLEFTGEKEEVSLGRYLLTTNSLDGKGQKLKIDEDSNYYLKIVGSKWGEQNMFAFTSHHSRLKIQINKKRSPSNERLPSVVFRYEFDPITMRYQSRYGNVVVSFLAIMGGVFSISVMCSNVLQSLGW